MVIDNAAHCTCGTCGYTWDYNENPTPAHRCPREQWHEPDDTDDHNAGWAWSITYGGDEPISHPFYRVLVDAMRGLKVEATTHGGATVVGVCCGTRSDEVYIDDVCLPLMDIYNIHIC